MRTDGLNSGNFSVASRVFTYVLRGSILVQSFLCPGARVARKRMAPFYTLYVRRSDGKIQAQVHGVIEQNEPTQDQLNQSPNAQGICDFYRLCKPDDPKVLDWRRKLGGMLIREVGAKEPKGKIYTSLLPRSV